jgi:hypothetical protein
MTISVIKLPLAKMTFSPDVPAAALGPNEYNSGQNVETDVRGIRSVAGDQEILDWVPGTPNYVTGNYRADGQYWFLVATDEGKWYAGTTSTYGPSWIDVTPSVGDFTQYNQATNITDSWNGTVAFLNDEHNPPMFWPDNGPGGTISPLIMYSNQQPINVGNIGITSSTWRTAYFTATSNVTSFTSAPFQVGANVIIAGANPRYYDGTYPITACDTTSVTFVSSITDPFVYDGNATVSPQYTWNYNPNWNSVYAKFLRQYNTPNVGSILVAGNLTANPVNTTSTVSYPVTVQWSQNFGLNSAPQTWVPTVVNVANQLEVPLRGPALDGFQCGGLFFLCSYWDTVVFSPLNYATTSAPILGVRLFTQGRGLLSSNCWVSVDSVVYGVDARDIWVFDGQSFTGIGNQRVKNYFYDQLDPQYQDRVFMARNSQKNQVELYYPDRNATNGVPNKMLAYRYDIDCWNAPRDVDEATFAVEAPVYDFTRGDFNKATRGLVYARGCTNQRLVQKDQGYEFIECVDGSIGTSTPTDIVSEFRRDNVKLLDKYTAKVMVHRVLPEVNNLGAVISVNDNSPIYDSSSTFTITVEGANSVGSTASVVTPVTLFVDANGNPGQNPWAQINQNAYRVNTFSIDNASTSSIWHCSAITWQIAQVEEDR